ASELSVTQSAVSRQIQLLEDHLGTSLFLRRSRGLELTPEGERLHRAVAMGLEHIANVAADIRRHRTPGELTIATSVTFASYWLMARLASFRAAHPEIELRLVASSPVYDLTAAGIDLAIRYGEGEWPGVEAERLFDDEIWPVCSPRYMNDRKQILSPRDLLGETLLHLNKFDRNWVTWETFLAAFGVTEEPEQRGLIYDNYMVLIQSALRGEGIALCGRRLAEDFIAQGELVRPIKETLSSDRGFYLLRPKDQPMSHAAREFHNWLVAEASRPE
ncbi:MAG: LysR substrate-binding domain-containing protein, partial [Hyphomicrobiales bacterium]|nr:LysR substrate-binding domain-containing protein [Hyphomicrobiales bacterium]